MAKVIAIGQPVNDSERQAIAHLRDRLPTSYTILHNFEIQQRNEFFEVDLAVIAPHAIYVVDVKGTRGNIDVYGGNVVSRTKATVQLAAAQAARQREGAERFDRRQQSC